jgi:hypothetical protein
MRIVDLYGPPHERGLQHGEALRDLIALKVSSMRARIREEQAADPDEFIRDFLNYVDFDAAIERWTPGLLEEVRGIAVGANQDDASIKAIQYLDEMWWYARLRWREIHGSERLGADEHDACSALGVITSGQTFVAQNQDFGVEGEGFQALLHLREQDGQPEAFVFTAAGMVAIQGMNRAGIGICCNTLSRLDVNQRGLPVAFVVRGVLSRWTFAEAAAFLEAAPHASGQNYVIGGPGEVGSFECSAHAVARYAPFADGSRTYHTNHPLVNTDDGQFREANGSGEVDFSPNSVARQAALERWLSDPSRSIGFDEIVAILSSTEDAEFPVCNAATAASMICELSADPPRMYLSAGRIPERSLLCFEFSQAPVSGATV